MRKRMPVFVPLFGKEGIREILWNMMFRKSPLAPLYQRGGVSFIIAICCLVTVLLSSCSNQKEQVFRKSKVAMDTLVSISVVADSEEKAGRAIDAAFAKVEGLDPKVNFFSLKSEVSLINGQAGVSAVTVSPETLEVISKAIETSGKTGGAFDATVGPESVLWDFSHKKRPNDKSIKDRLSLVDYRGIIVDRDKATVRLSKKGMLLDLGAIAKGYAADKAVEELKRQGIKAGLVAVAGDIKAFGRKPDGSGWKVGIRNPRSEGKGDEIIATIELVDKAVSTSGDYERYFFEDGMRFHHILDPKTGYPARGSRSVTVIAANGVEADSFSTAVFVLGPKEGMKLLEKIGFDGLVVDEAGEIFMTSGLRGKVELKGKH